MRTIGPLGGGTEVADIQQIGVLPVDLACVVLTPRAVATDTFGDDNQTLFVISLDTGEAAADEPAGDELHRGALDADPAISPMAVR